MLSQITGSKKEATLIVGYLEDSDTKANYSRSGLKVIKYPFTNIMALNNQLKDLLGDDKYDIVFEHGLERPELYLDSYTTVKNPKEAMDILKDMNSQKKPDSPSSQPAPKEKEEPKVKTKENKKKKKKAKEEKTEEKKEKEKASLPPPGTQEKEKEEKEEKKKEKREEKTEEKEEKTEASPEKEKEEKKEEKSEGDGKGKEKGEEKGEADKKEEEKEEEQITYVFDPYTQENYRYLYPKKYKKTEFDSDDMKDWKERWFGEQVYVSRLALMQAAWIICEVFNVGEISSDDAMQVIQLIMRCRNYEDFNSSASNVLSNDRLRFNIDKNDPTSQEVAVAYFERLSHVASWYTTLSRLLIKFLACLC